MWCKGLQGSAEYEHDDTMQDAVLSFQLLGAPQQFHQLPLMQRCFFALDELTDTDVKGFA